MKNEFTGRLTCFVIASAAALTGCDTKGDLSAYLHKTSVAAEANGPSAHSAVVPVVAHPPGVHRAAAVAGPAISAGSAPVVVTTPVSPGALQALPTVPVAPPGFKGSRGLEQPLPVAPTTVLSGGSRAWPGPSSVPALAAPTPAALQGIASPRKEGKRNASVGGSSVSGGTVGNAARVVAGLRAGLRDCYSRETSDAVGSIRFTLSIGSNGTVSNATAAPSGELSSGLLACATAHVRGAKFDPPEGGAASMRIPVTFFIQ